MSAGEQVLRLPAKPAAGAAWVDRMYRRAWAVHHDPHCHPAKQLH